MASARRPNVLVVPAPGIGYFVPPEAGLRNLTSAADGRFIGLFLLFVGAASFRFPAITLKYQRLITSFMVPAPGIEPGTLTLRVSCSAD